MHVCFVGDSLVNGMGDPECLGWAGRLIVAARRQGHDVTHDNLGIRRDTSADVRARWADEVGRRLGVSAMTVCRMEKQALECLRRQFAVA